MSSSCRTIRCGTRESWLSKRSRYIGSSDLAGILGYGYSGQSAYGIWLEKTTGIGQEFDDEAKRRMKLGQIMEPAIAQVFELQTGWPVNHEDNVIRVSRDYPGLACSLDGWCVDGDGKNAVVEMKFLGSHARYELDDGAIPVKHNLQIQHQLMVCGWDVGYLCVLIGNEPIITTVPRHEGLCAQIWVKCQEFLQCVESGEPPEIDGSEATWEAVKQANQRVDRDITPIPEGLRPMVDQYERSKAEKDKATEAMTEAKSKLADAVGDAEIGYFQDGTSIKWGMTKSGSRRFGGVMKKIPFEVREALDGS